MQMQDKGQDAKGSIPKKLAVWLRKPIEHKFYRESGVHKAAMVTDADSKPSQVTAERWAKGGQYWSPAGAYKDNEAVPEPDAIDNEPIPWLRVVGLDIRSEGGRAWKVLTPEGYLVDLRDDVLLEVLFNKGVPKGGKIKGPFQWVKLGSQMRIVLVKSTMYKAIQKSQEERAKKKARPRMKAADLVVGGLYSTQMGSIKLYFGRVRYKGKLCFLWFEDWLRWRGSENASVEEITRVLLSILRKSANNWSTVPLFVTGSVSSNLELVGKINPMIKLGEIPGLDFRDGYGGRILLKEFDLFEVE